MDKTKFLSGEDLVARGTTKIDGSLPEVGLKDVFPNGSWLEQKQIQSALEARKNLIEVERIEKCGVLSHAIWREDLMLAEVTQKVGGHWQYIGHNVGKRLFLKPEEALYLMEVNCLCLKHNDVTVSLQQAYFLLLRSEISLIQYKVYASLSRLGYKIFRHDCKPTQKCNQKSDLNSFKNKQDGSGNVAMDIEFIKETTEPTSEQSKTHTDNVIVPMGDKYEKEPEIQVDTDAHSQKSTDAKHNIESIIHSQEDKCLNNALEINAEEETGTSSNIQSDHVRTETRLEGCCVAEKLSNEVKEKLSNEIRMEDGDINNVTEKLDVETNNIDTQNSSKTIKESPVHKSKLQLLESRKLKPCSSKDLHKHFEKIPDLYQKHTATVKVPEDQYLPKNVLLNNANYVLNIDNIKTKSKDVRPASTESRSYSVTEEVNGAHVRRVRDTFAAQNNWNPTFTPPARFTGHNPQFRPFQFWRPRMSYFHFNLLFQRPFLPSINFVPRMHLFAPRPPLIPPFSNIPSFNSNNPNRNVPNNRKRTRDSAKHYHLEAIKRLALRLKQLVLIGNTQAQNIQSLQRLIQTYNTRYKTSLILTDDFDIVNDENILETIELDDDEESRSKRPRTDTSIYEENYDSLSNLALKLKELESGDKANARHRRAFSSLVKRFNKTYGTDIFLNSTYEICDRKQIILDTSSDSDCVIEETPKLPSGKKLRNPFNILKRLSEKQNSSILSPTTSKEGHVEETVNVEDNKSKYSEILIKTFGRYWLPGESDFGRADVISKHRTSYYFFDSRKEEYLYDFIKNQDYNFDSWLDTKIAFLRNIQETTVQEMCVDNTGLNSIIRPEDCTDMPSILKKLSIIQSHKDVHIETSLTLHFDAYNRDVQNFRKSNRPKPHFRVICLSESSIFPSGRDVAALHHKYSDGVVIMFAIVGVSSISYLQINPANIPVYIPNHDLT